MNVREVLMVVVMAAAAAVAVGNGSRQQDAVGALWQGLDFAWQRKLFDVFETPHRLGSWASWIDNTAQRANITFTPGVDGDVAHPRTFYTALPTSVLNDTAFSTVTLRGTDRINTNHTVPEAWLGLEANLTNLTGASVAQAALPAHSVLAIQGFHLNASCDSTCGTCNSNGAWLFHFNLSLATCQGAACVRLSLGRGWTPSEGGGKALNTCMTYTVHVLVALIRADAVALPPLVVREQSLFGPLINSTVAIVGPLASGLQASVLAVSSMGWNLSSPRPEENLGRYLEQYRFAVGTANWSPAAMAWLFNVSAYVTSPAVTTYPANVTTTLGTVWAGWRSGVAGPGPQRVALGTVCKDDPATAFSCRAHGYPAQLDDSIPLSLP